MNMTLLAVGKTDVSWVKEGLELYVSRLRRYVPFKLEEIPHLKNAAALSEAVIKEKEGEIIMSKLRPADYVVLLDEHGKEYRSVEFAQKLETLMSRSSRDIVFVIGGAYGFSEAVYSRADEKLSLSKMTFSHQMVRTVFAEQLYRAFTIIKGEPYHHE
ncbi:MAG: 23S rRNA (pseudouridine(1915)-N(3))-methyltransferase RlmH [Bacteroidales bacterium]|nr:23S rRNA (pseudouridine(1915)-N(3))-methyltransferase RlmH [Bacteroidales bacterium]